MCGIIGYSGFESADKIITEGLHALEYRGYDSAGMAVFADGEIKTVKTRGRVAELESKAHALLPDASGCGIGHTRWATHGKPSEENAHPHGTDSLMLVHNGIIENYKEIKAELIEKGYSFVSQTDTEVASKLIDYEYSLTDSKINAILAAVKRLKGSYAFGIVFNDEPGSVYAVKKDSPLLIGLGENENFIASDVSAFIKRTRKYIRIEDGETVRLTQDSVEIFNTDGEKIEKSSETAEWTSADAEKQGFSHFMLKEIYEEPEVMRRTFDSVTSGGAPDFSATVKDDEFLKNIGTVHVIACGTAMHAGLLGKYYIERLARIPVNVEIASEFRYRNPILSDNDLVIIISQSGETADSLAALRLVNKRNIRTLSIVNTVGSTIARESKNVIYTKAGPEIAVASTKAFSVQTEALFILALKLAILNGKIDESYAKQLCASLLDTFENGIKEVLANTDEIISASKAIARHNDIFFIGRGLDSYMGMEASLKLKEISYIHSESYAAGELKHGTISLVEEGTPVIAIASDGEFYEKMRSNIEEVRSRGAFVVSIGAKDADIIKGASDLFIPLPDSETLTRPFTAATVIQLLAYYTALELGRDIDKPRNLAKSVTVE